MIGHMAYLGHNLEGSIKMGRELLIWRARGSDDGMVKALKRLGSLPQRKYHNAYYSLVLSCIVEPCGGFNRTHLK